MGMSSMNNASHRFYAPKGVESACVTHTGFVQTSTNHGLYTELNLNNSFMAGDEVLMILNMAGEQFYMSTLKYLTVQPGTYVVQFKKKVVVKLPHPYSECVAADDRKHNIFGGNYTMGKCKQTKLLRRMRNICKAIPHQFRSYFKEDASIRASSDRLIIIEFKTEGLNFSHCTVWIAFDAVIDITNPCVFLLVLVL